LDSFQLADPFSLHRGRHALGRAGTVAAATERSPSYQPSGRFALDLLDAGCGQIVDRDPARLYGVRNLSNQLDLQQAVVEPCSLDP
jgi:hypothetical protein